MTAKKVYTIDLCGRDEDDTSPRETAAVREGNAMDQKPMCHFVLDVRVIFDSVDPVHSIARGFDNEREYISVNIAIRECSLAEGAPPE